MTSLTEQEAGTALDARYGELSPWMDRLRTTPHGWSIDDWQAVCDAIQTVVERANKSAESIERAQELEDLFDLRWKADQRAIKRWRAAGTGRQLTSPDRADMVVWLLDQMDEFGRQHGLRVAELLTYNNEQVELRRAADARSKALHAAVVYADECFEAALFEGWLDALANGDIERIQDIWSRRLNWARNQFPAALAGTPPSDTRDENAKRPRFETRPVNDVWNGKPGVGLYFGSVLIVSETGDGHWFMAIVDEANALIDAPELPLSVQAGA